MTDKLSSPAIGEGLSALMDGELTDFEMRRLLQRVSGDEESRAQWARYQLVSSVMQRESCHPVSSLRLADTVQRAIAQEEALPAAAMSQQPAIWKKPVARFAVAASVAMVVVIGGQWRQGSLESSVQVVATASPPGMSVRRTELSGAVPNSPLLVSQPLSRAVLPGTVSEVRPVRAPQYRVDWNPELYRSMQPPARNGLQSESPR